jgi:inorganic pyrophosphatase
VNDPRFKDVLNLSDIKEHILDEIADFFKCYKRLQNKVTEVEGFFDKDTANSEISRYLNNYPEYKE